MSHAGTAAIREVLAAYAAITAATVAIAWLGQTPPLADYVHVVVGMLFLISALQLAQRAPGGLAAHGLVLGGVLEPSEPPPTGWVSGFFDMARALARAAPSALRETGFALLVAALVFPPFALGFRAYHEQLLGEGVGAFALSFPGELPAYIATQLLVVALPEEALFRGYIQGRLTQASAGRVRVLGASIAPTALIAQAALFALIHLAVEPHPGRLAVFFPGLLFGLVRELRGGIGAAIVLHAASNLFGDVLARSWL